MRSLADKWFLPGFAALLLSIVFLLWYATSQWGLGQTWDSVEYLVSALSSAKGDGFLVIGKAGLFEPMSYRPPLYTLLLSAGLFFGVALSSWAIFINICCYTVTVGCVAFSVLQVTQRAGVALFTALFVACLPHVVLVHLYVWSEPLFLALTALSLTCLIIARERRALVWVCMAAFFAGLSCMTRYVGVAVILTGWAAAWSFFRDQKKNGFSSASIFLGVACLFPAIYFFTRIALFGPSQALAWGMYLTPDKCRLFVDTLSCWFFPAAWPLVVRSLLLLGVIGYIVKVAASLRIRRDHPGAMVLLFMAVYLVVVLASSFTVAADVKLDPRLMVPMLISFVCMLPVVLDVRRSKIAGGILLVLFVLAFLRTGQLVLAHHERGAGYSGQAVQKSALAKEIKTMADNVDVYTDDPAAFYGVTRRLSMKIPLSVESGFHFDGGKAIRALKERRAFVVLFGCDEKQVHLLWQKVVYEAGLEVLFQDGKSRILGRRQIKE
jgi:4-amino-4-deoxy-L-arabinose transferase-like glycosyltransferase